jgi:hypothetical protein
MIPQVAGAVRERQPTRMLTTSNLFGNEEVFALARRTCA